MVTVVVEVVVAWCGDGGGLVVAWRGDGGGGGGGAWCG